MNDKHDPNLTGLTEIKLARFVVWIGRRLQRKVPKAIRQIGNRKYSDGLLEPALRDMVAELCAGYPEEISENDALQAWWAEQQAKEQSSD